jgi:hypothetical protein
MVCVYACMQGCEVDLNRVCVCMHARRDVMDALAAELLTSPAPGAATSGNSRQRGDSGGGGGGGAARGIPFVRIDGSHTSEEVRALLAWCLQPHLRVKLAPLRLLAHESVKLHDITHAAHRRA